MPVHGIYKMKFDRYGEGEISVFTVRKNERTLILFREKFVET